MLEEVIFFFSSSSFPSFPLFSRDLFTFVLVLIGWRENSGGDYDFKWSGGCIFLLLVMDPGMKR